MSRLIDVQIDVRPLSLIVDVVVGPLLVPENGLGSRKFIFHFNPVCIRIMKVSYIIGSRLVRSAVFLIQLINIRIISF